MKALLSLVLISILAGCATSPHAPAPTAAVPAPADAPAATQLTRYHWQLDGVRTASGEHTGILSASTNKPLTLVFDATGMSVRNACNVLRAPYRIVGDKLLLDHFLSTMMLCADPALNQLDQAVRQSLAGTLAFTIDTSGAAPHLILTDTHGNRLRLLGIPTAATRYGSVGKTLFLEIASATRPCNPSPHADAQCLYVRQLNYAANGTRAGFPGSWHVLGQPIEGYTHHAGTRNVIRVKRYDIAHPAADGASVAYVMDTVIESEVVDDK